MRSTSMTAAVFTLALVLAALGCGKGSSSTTAPPTGGPRFNFTFPAPGPNGTSHQLVINDVGTWAYQCTPHGASNDMRGTIMVSAAGADSVPITIVNFEFQPRNVSIKAGGYVRWHNESNMTNHTATR